MRRLTNQVIGIDQGEVVLFSDFQDDGPMWTGSDAREKRVAVEFSEAYSTPPSVHVTLAMIDISNMKAHRTDISAENISVGGFEIVFRTWGDSKVARVRAAWTSIGPVSNIDDWDLH